MSVNLAPPRGVILVLLCTALLELGFQNCAVAQQVPTDPTSTHIFPAGGRRGTKVDVRVGSECLPPHSRFRLWGAGVSAPLELGPATSGDYAPSPRRKPTELPITYVREWQSQIEIGAEAPLGAKLWRLSCARGGTGGRPFIVGDLPEFIETEPNSRPHEAQKVTLPVTVNGQIAGESDLDYYSFDAQPGDLVRVDMVAARLGSALDPVIELYGPNGSRVAVDEVRVGADPVLAYKVVSPGEYRLLVSNVNFHGGPSYVYRVTISTAPFAHFAFPAGGTAGAALKTNCFTLSGEGTLFPLPEQLVLPTALGEQWLTAQTGMNALPFTVGGLPEAIETEGNDTKETATELAWPLTMNGQFQSKTDDDWYRLAARKDTPLTIECVTVPRWSPALPIVTVTDINGGPLAHVSAVQTPRGSIRIEWAPPADGDYRIRVRDLQQGVRGGPEFIYRLGVRPATPDFSLFLKSDVANVVQGGRTDLEVAVERRGGFNGPLELKVQGLPDGVKIEGQQVAPGQETARLALIADADARSQDVTLTITGVAEIAGKPMERVAAATHLGHDADGVGLGPTTIDNVQLTVMHKPVFKLYCNEAYQYAHRGTVYPYLMEVERLDGFAGPIRLQVADRQIKDLDGIELVDTTVKPEQSQFMLPIYLPETMHINVQAHSNVYAQGDVEFVDKHGQKQTLLVVSTMRCMIRTLPTVAKLRTVERELVAKRGAAVTCRLALDRTSHFSGPMQVQLVEPDAASGISAKPVTIPEGATSGEIVVNLAADAFAASPAGARQPALRQLKFRAIGTMADGVQVISEATLPLKVVE